jgi:hypothetical protein
MQASKLRLCPQEERSGLLHQLADSGSSEDTRGKEIAQADFTLPLPENRVVGPPDDLSSRWRPVETEKLFRVGETQ